MRRLASIVALIALAASASLAETATSLEVQAYYGFPNHAAADSGGFVPVEYGELPASTGEREIGSSWGNAGAKAILDRKLTFPCMAGRGALTEGNNLALDFVGSLSPVSVNADLSATLTPIAFLKLAVGAGAGTGWDIGFIGLGLNEAGVIKPENFGGLVYRAWASATFQFDLAAVLPGDWNHVVVLASPRLEYQAYTGADSGTAWIWEADDAMDLNGLKLKGSYVLAYQMPLALSMAGFLLETEGYVGSAARSSPMSSAGWGSDYTTLALSAILSFALSERASLTMLPQIKSGIKWTDSTTKLAYFADRDYDGSYWYFNRVAFDFVLEL